MKKSLIICILIIGVIFISGCTNEEQTETPISSQNSRESATEPTGSILKSGDVIGFTFSYHFYAVPKNTLFVCNNDNVKSLGGIGGNLPLNKFGAKGYTDTLPLGYRNVGEDYTWDDQSGKLVSVSVIKYDSDPDSLLIETFTNTKERQEKQFAEFKELGELEKQEEYGDSDVSDPQIGDISYFVSLTDPETDIQLARIAFIHDTTHVSVMVADEKGISKETAIRISKIIEKRLNQKNNY